MDSFYIEYTGLPLTHIPVPTNTNLEVILGLIDTAIVNNSSAPNYSGYNLYCVTQTDGSTHPTNTQNFAEGISKILCDFKTAYTAFVGTTYVTDQAVITAAINALQVPAVTYSPFSITNTDTNTQVWNKSFTGFTAIINSIKPDASNWSSIGASTATSIVSAFNTLIAYELTQDTAIGTKQVSLGTFNTTSIGGGIGTIPATAISQLITYAATLPTFDHTAVTTTCVTTSTTLQGYIQNILNTLDGLMQGSVQHAGTGLTMSGTTCSGKTLAVDTTWSGLYKVAVDGSDTTPANLNAKLSAGTGITLAILSPGGNEQVQITNSKPADGKVLVNSSDTTSGYLNDKIVGTLGAWGMNIATTVDSSNSVISVTPEINSPSTFVNNLFEAIASDPQLLAQFCALAARCSTTCAAPTGLSVAINTGDYVLTWTPGAGALSQKARYKAFNSNMWIADNNFNPPNPQTGIATTTTITGTAIPKNVVYQFAIDNICASGTTTSNIYEQVIFAAQSLSSIVDAMIISVNQSPLLTVNTIEYRLRNNSNVVVDTKTGTGISPQVSFAAQNSGNYTVQWRYGATVNGATLYSDDASQLNAWCTSGTITIP